MMHKELQGNGISCLVQCHQHMGHICKISGLNGKRIQQNTNNDRGGRVQPSANHCRALKYNDRDDKTPAFGAAKEISTFIDCM